MRGDPGQEGASPYWKETRNEDEEKMRMKVTRTVTGYRMVRWLNVVRSVMVVK